VKRGRLLAAFAALLLSFPGRLPAEVLGFEDAAAAFRPAPDGFHLGDELSAGDDTPRPADEPAPPPSPPPPGVATPPPPPRLFDAKTTAVTAAVALGAPTIGYFAWWQASSRSSFQFANERWFQSDTYAGGADKASHIYLGYMSTLTLQEIYRTIGKTPAEARALAFGAMVLTGVLIEVGDGYSQYGFSWEDATANTIGASLATAIDAWKLQDTVGLRLGFVKALKPDACCRFGGYGDDYSKEIYSADVKLGGLLPRLGVKPGPARFLLLSMTYGSKGYRYSAAPLRERNVGAELGLNLREVLLAVGVPEKKWWGQGLLLLATYFRIPYTSFGWHYDLNHGKWSGPDTGDHFTPGSITYN
jgi:hypothetical protein